MNTPVISPALTDPPSPRDRLGHPPFPSGVSVLALVWGFASTRLLVGLALRHPGIAAAGVFATVTGIFLGLGSTVVLAWQSTSRPSPFRWLTRGVRLAVLVPVILLALAAMTGNVSRGLQSWGLIAACIAVVMASFHGIFIARRHSLARATLALLAVGETLEFLSPSARVAFEGRVPLALALQVGPWVEITAFVGVFLALAWAIRDTIAVATAPRFTAIAVMPAGFAVILASLPLRYPRTSEMIARYAFGARFDLATHGAVSHPSSLAMAAYTFLASGLLAASTLSLAGQYLDHGGAPRRMLGWVCILLGGFGAVTMAGPVDPLRVVAVVLGVMLLEQSLVCEYTPTDRGA